MSNVFGVFMSYCRQEGAYKAMQEALDQVTEYYDNPDMEMSETEVESFKDNIRYIYDWMNDMCLIDGEGTFDEGELNNLCDELLGEY